jgi:hypothetical protein
MIFILYPAKAARSSSVSGEFGSFSGERHVFHALIVENDAAWG